MGLSRRSFLGGSLAAVGIASTAPQPPAAAETAAFLPYTSDSFYKSRVDAAPVDADRTTSFRAFMATFPDQVKYPHPQISGQKVGQKINPWGTTVHLGQPEDPIWKLSNPRTETQILATQGWHMADSVADRIPTGLQDRPLLVVDQMFGYSAFGGDVVADRATRTITAGQSGIFWHTSNGLDRRNPRTTDARNFCARGRIPDSMVIRPDLLQAGIANGTSLGHVLQVNLVETDARTFGTGYVHPMVGTEARHIAGWGAEGERIRISPTVDLVARGLTGGALVIARTLQQYGAYIGDNSGSATMLKGAQSSATYYPYAGTNVTTDCLKGKVTWNDFEVVVAGWQ